jgi:glutathione S-transferase
MEWEKYVDEEIGVHVRRCCYHILLEHPDIVISFFTNNGPWYGKYIVPCMFPKLKIKMRELMIINEETAKTSRQHLGIAIDR